MVNYLVKYDYMVEEYGEVATEADDVEQAEQFAREYVLETYPEAVQVVIGEVTAVD